MDNNRGSGDESSDSSIPDEYEENEVVWAKIHGYPWWPAYVHSIKKMRKPYIQFFSSATILSIVFFQSLLSSRITFQKLRKFQPNFQIFASFAKKHYKLKMALQSTYEQLNENREDVTYFNIDKHLKNEKSLNKLSNHNKRPSSIQKEDILEESNQKNLQFKIKIKPYQQKMLQQFKNIPEGYSSLKQNRKKPGRPRKIRQDNVQQRQNILQKSMIANVNPQCEHLLSYQFPIKPFIIQNENETILHHKDQKGKNNSVKSEETIKQPIKKSLQSICTTVISPTSQQSQKINTATFEKIKNEILASSKKDLFTLFYNLQLNNDLLFKMLEFNILSKIEYKINNRQYQKIKEKLQKMLLNIYFNYNMNNFEGSKRDLIRNKVKKKIYGALRMKSRSRQDKMKVIGLQGRMWVKFKNNKQLYMKCVIECLDRLKVIDIGDLIQEWREDTFANELDH